MDGHKDASSKGTSSKAKQYEVKIATITSINNALQSENEKLRRQLQAASAPKNVAEEELDELREEFAQRLGALDRNIADLKKEREDLRYKLEEETEKTANLASKSAANEKEVETLRAEVKELKEVNNSFDSTAKKAYSAKNELEGENEALAARVEALEFELKDVQANAEAQVSQNILRINELENEASEIRRKAHLAASEAEAEAAEAAQQMEAAARERESVLMTNLQDLRADFDKASSQWEQKEWKLKREIATLEDSIQQHEVEKLDIQAQASNCSKPLLKQLEAVMAASEQQQMASLQAEDKLREELSLELQKSSSLQAEAGRFRGKAKALQEELNAKVEALHASQQEKSDMGRSIASLEGKIKDLEVQVKSGQEVLGKERNRLAKKEQGRIELEEELNSKLTSKEGTIQLLRAENHRLIEELDRARVQGREPLTPDQREPPLLIEKSENPTGEVLVGLSKVDSAFDDEFKDMFEPAVGVLQGGRSDGVEGIRFSKSKHQGDGHDGAWARKLAMVEKDREKVAEELCSAMAEIRVAKESAAELEVSYAELEKRHDLALEIIGERNEKVEQLELDITEMKEIFHQQLEVCVGQLSDLRLKLSESV